LAGDFHGFTGAANSHRGVHRGGLVDLNDYIRSHEVLEALLLDVNLVCAWDEINELEASITTGRLCNLLRRAGVR